MLGSAKDLRFPIIGYDEDGDINLVCFREAKFERVRIETIPFRLGGIDLFDAGGAGWRVKSVRAAEEIRWWMPRFFKVLAEWELESIPPRSLDQIRDEYARRLRLEPEAWFPPYFVGGENDEWIEPDQLVEMEIEKLQAMTSIAEFCVRLGERP